MNATKPAYAHSPLITRHTLAVFATAFAACAGVAACASAPRRMDPNLPPVVESILDRGADGQGAMSAEQYERLAGEIEANHQGARNAGRPMLLEGGLDWKPMGFSPSDMEFHKTKDAAAREIALAFGVPPMLLGIPGDATYANYAEANRAFYRLTVLPLVGRVTGALSAWLAGFAGEDLAIKPDLDQVPALAVERDQLWVRVNAAEFLSEAEKRRLLGLPVERVDG